MTKSKTANLENIIGIVTRQSDNVHLRAKVASLSKPMRNIANQDQAVDARYEWNKFTTRYPMSKQILKVQFVKNMTDKLLKKLTDRARKVLKIPANIDVVAVALITILGSLGEIVNIPEFRYTYIDSATNDMVPPSKWVQNSRRYLQELLELWREYLPLDLSKKALPKPLGKLDPQPFVIASAFSGNSLTQAGAFVNNVIVPGLASNNSKIVILRDDLQDVVVDGFPMRDLQFRFGNVWDQKFVEFRYNAVRKLFPIAAIIFNDSMRVNKSGVRLDMVAPRSGLKLPVTSMLKYVHGFNHGNLINAERVHSIAYSKFRSALEKSEALEAKYHELDEPRRLRREQAEYNGIYNISNNEDNATKAAKEQAKEKLYKWNKTTFSKALNESRVAKTRMMQARQEIVDVLMSIRKDPEMP